VILIVVSTSIYIIYESDVEELHPSFASDS